MALSFTYFVKIDVYFHNKGLVNQTEKLQERKMGLFFFISFGFGG